MKRTTLQAAQSQLDKFQTEIAQTRDLMEAARNRIGEAVADNDEKRVFALRKETSNLQQRLDELDAAIPVQEARVQEAEAEVEKAKLEKQKAQDLKQQRSKLKAASKLDSVLSDLETAYKEYAAIPLPPGVEKTRLHGHLLNAIWESAPQLGERLFRVVDLSYVPERHRASLSHMEQQVLAGLD